MIFLQGTGLSYRLKKQTASMMVFVVEDKDRFAAKEKVENAAKENRLEFKDGVKSSDSIDIKTTDITYEGMTYRFFFKPASGGSGAGAEVTALGECFQAYACAARQAKGSNLETAEEVFDIMTSALINNTTDCDRTLEQCRSGLDPDWLNSGVVIANTFAKRLGVGSKYKFLRGGSIVSNIEKTYNELKKKAGIKFNINKWNPADIWAVKQTFRPTFDFDTLDEYNKYILNHFNSNDMIGISLKKLSRGATRATEEIFNGGNVRQEAKFSSFRITPQRKDFFDKSLSKDAYIEYKVGSKTISMQLRTFSAGMSGWQGEIKGSTAAGGKIGGGNLQDALVLAGIVPSSFIDQTAFKPKSKIDNKQTIKDMVKFYEYLTGKKTNSDEMADHLKNFDNNWLYSKYLSMQFIYMMKINKKENAVCSMIDSIAASSTPVSSVFLKYS